VNVWNSRPSSDSKARPMRSDGTSLPILGASDWNATVTSGALAMICSISFCSCSESTSSRVARWAFSCCDSR
jgi:hypothetical protein